MNLPVMIDLSEIAMGLRLSAEESSQLGEYILDKLAERYSQSWNDEVNRNLRSTRLDYLRAMSVERISSNTIDFNLNYSKDNPVPVMMELGYPPFNEKEGFSTSSKRKLSKGGGWYLTIPFRHATSESLAESGAFNSVLPREVLQLVKSSSTPLAQKILPPAYNSPGERAAISRMNMNVGAYTHKNPIYQGLVRKDISSTVKEKRSGYFTFRRVSDKSDPESWWHGGFVKKDLMGKAVRNMNIQQVVARAIDEYFR